MPIQKIWSLTGIAANGLQIDTFSEISWIPKVNGGPKYCIAYSEVSVNTTTCWRVSTAVTISDPEPRRKSPAVVKAVLSHWVKLSWSENRINNGS